MRAPDIEKLLSAAVVMLIAALVVWLIPLTTSDAGSAAIGYGGVPLALGADTYLTPLGITLVVSPTLWVALASPVVIGLLLIGFSNRLGRALRLSGLALFAISCGTALALVRLLWLT